MMEDKVEGKAVDVVLADETSLIGLIDRRLQAVSLAHEFPANIDVGGVGIHGEAGD